MSVNWSVIQYPIRESLTEQYHFPTIGNNSGDVSEYLLSVVSKETHDAFVLLGARLETRYGLSIVLRAELTQAEQNVLTKAFGDDILAEDVEVYEIRPAGSSN